MLPLPVGNHVLSGHDYYTPVLLELLTLICPFANLVARPVCSVSTDFHKTSKILLSQLVDDLTLFALSWL